jgi:hypothetical protein
MVDPDPSPRAVRAFGVFWTPLALAALAFSLWRRGAPLAGSIGLASVAGVSVALAFAAPRALGRVYVGLAYVTAPLGWVVSRALLAAIFLLVVTPIGVALRLGGRDVLGRRGGAAVRSNWVPREDARDMERNFRQY